MTVRFFWACEATNENFDGSQSFPSSVNMSTDITYNNSARWSASSTSYGGTNSLDVDAINPGQYADISATDFDPGSDIDFGNFSFGFALYVVDGVPSYGGIGEFVTFGNSTMSTRIRVEGVNNWSTGNGGLRLALQSTSGSTNVDVGTNLSTNTWYGVIVRYNYTSSSAGDYYIYVYSATGTLIASGNVTNYLYAGHDGSLIDTLRLGDSGGYAIHVKFDNIVIDDTYSGVSADWFDGTIDNYDDLAGGPTTFAASGQVDLPGITADGSALVTYAADGQTTLPGITADGSSLITFTADGQTTLPAITVTGEASSVFDAAGSSINLPGLEISGTAALALDAAGSSISLPAITVSGAASGVLSSPTEGQPVLPAIIADGSALLTFISDGQTTLPAVTVAGDAAQTYDGAGQIDLPGLTVTGAAFASITGEAYGQVTLPAITANGAAGLALNAAGQVTLPGVTVGGTAAVPDQFSENIEFTLKVGQNSAHSLKSTRAAAFTLN